MAALPAHRGYRRADLVFQAHLASQGRGNQSASCRRSLVALHVCKPGQPPGLQTPWLCLSSSCDEPPMPWTCLPSALMQHIEIPVTARLGKSCKRGCCFSQHHLRWHLHWVFQLQVLCSLHVFTHVWPSFSLVCQGPLRKTSHSSRVPRGIRVVECKAKHMSECRENQRKI